MATNRQFGTGPGRTQVILPAAPAFQPGSTFKAITLAAAFTQGIPPSVTFNAPNRIVIPGRNSPKGGFGNAGDSEAGVYSADETQARAILSRVNAGSVYWNCCDRVSPRLPWSGYGDSGVGLTLSTYGIQTFTRPKAWHLRQA